MTRGSWCRFLKVYDPLKSGSIDGTDTRPHDKAVERAIESVYFPNKDITGDPMKTLFVARLNPETTEETLRKTFSKYGEIESLHLIKDIVTGFSKQYAFVVYDLQRDAEEACEESHGSYLDNHTIFVDWECERTLPKWIPRRFGGGFGGRKESGQLRFGGKERPFKRPFMLNKMGQDMRRARRGLLGKSEDNGERQDAPRRPNAETDKVKEDHSRREGNNERVYGERRGGLDRDRRRQRDGYREKSQDRESGRRRSRERERGRDRGYYDDRDRTREKREDRQG